jgi:phosphomannomutase
MKACLARLKEVADIGLVGGSDRNKIREQLDEDTVQLSDYFFSENGLVAYKGSQLIGKEVPMDPLRP